MREIVFSIPGVIDLITSKDELNYQEVLDDFPNATYIFVTTYNIHTRRQELVDLLGQFAGQADVRIISNIPGRAYGYAKKEDIRTYMTRLDPTLTGFTTAFAFDTHTKVVMTDNIAYVGSANFSEASSKSRETGVIVRDTSLVAQIRNTLVPLLEGEAIQYFGGSILEDLRVQFSLLLSRIGGLITRVEDEMFTYRETGPTSEEFMYNSIDPTISVRTLETIQATLESLVEEIEVLGEEPRFEGICKPVDTSLVRQVQALTSESTSLYNAAEFDPQATAWEATEDVRARDPETWEDHWNYAMEEALDKLADLAKAAKDDTYELISGLKQLLSQVESVISEVVRLRRQEKSI